MLTGTAYFPSRMAAASYYREGTEDVHAMVDEKLAEGAIFIGKPPHDPARQEVVLIDTGLRYGLRDLQTSWHTSTCASQDRTRHAACDCQLATSPAKMRSVTELAREELENIVRAAQAVLWQRDHEDTGEPCWDPETELSWERVEAIAGVMEKAGLKPAEGPTFHVNVYLVNKAWGGHEEGGWWYDTGHVKQSQWCATFEEAQRVESTLQAWCDGENATRRSDTSSVLSEGKFVVRIEHEPGVDYPAVRPVYS